MSWFREAVFYHLFPLGCLGAPARNDFSSPVCDRLSELHGWIDHLEDLGVDALFLGPVFESTAHGYDTADYARVDRRLGTAESLARLSKALHARGIRLVLDAVLNHVGRDFWAFRDVQARGRESAYQEWFHLDFSRRSPAGDRFWYEGWNGHYDLVKLNVANSEVRRHLFDVVTAWIETFELDGLRLDAADVLDKEFQRALAVHCRSVRPDFWLKGEVIHGDYRQWIDVGGLDSVTNYVLYKGLYSSHNDRNFFELAHTLNQQYGEPGTYRDLSLYTFADNHDVARISSQLKEPSHLYPLHLLLMTLPGVPSLYYGSEWGIAGTKGKATDAPLRPALSRDAMERHAPHPDLLPTIRRLIGIRRELPALRHGAYRPLHVAHEQFAFARTVQGVSAVVAVNAAAEGRTVSLQVPSQVGDRVRDVLSQRVFECKGGRLELPLDASWGRILVPCA